MKTQKTIPVIIVTLALVLAACVPGKDATKSTTDAMMEKPAATEEMMAEEPMSTDNSMDQKTDETMTADDSMSENHGDSMDQTMDDSTAGSMENSMDDSSMMEAPAWFQTEFVNVNTGETFSINGLKGKVILVETMAAWCSNCLQQQKQVKELHGLLGNTSDLVSIGIDIDPNEDDAVLSNYVKKQGFDWVYTVANADVAREIGSLYGDQFLNPPSTPILIIDRQGNAHSLPFGIKDAATLKEAVQPFLDEAM